MGAFATIPKMKSNGKFSKLKTQIDKVFEPTKSTTVGLWNQTFSNKIVHMFILSIVSFFLIVSFYFHFYKMYNIFYCSFLFTFYDKLYNILCFSRKPTLLNIFMTEWNYLTQCWNCSHPYSSPKETANEYLRVPKYSKARTRHTVYWVYCTGGKTKHMFEGERNTIVRLQVYIYLWILLPLSQFVTPYVWGELGEIVYFLPQLRYYTHIS